MGGQNSSSGAKPGNAAPKRAAAGAGNDEDGMSKLNNFVDGLFEPRPVNQVFAKRGGDGVGAPDGPIEYANVEPQLDPGGGTAWSSSQRLPSVAPGERSDYTMDPSGGEHYVPERQYGDSYQWPSSKYAEPPATVGQPRWQQPRPVPSYAEGFYHACDVLCRYCGALVHDTCQFCPHCGTPMSRVAGPDLFSERRPLDLYERVALTRSDSSSSRRRSLSPTYAPVVGREYVDVAAAVSRPRARPTAIDGLQPLRSRSFPRDVGVTYREAPVASAPARRLFPPTADGLTLARSAPTPVPRIVPPAVPGYSAAARPTHQLVHKKYVVESGGAMAPFSRQPLANAGLAMGSSFPGSPPAPITTTVIQSAASPGMAALGGVPTTTTTVVVPPSMPTMPQSIALTTVA